MLGKGNRNYASAAGKNLTIEGPVDTEDYRTRGTGNLFQFFTTSTENAPLLRRRRLGPCSNLPVCPLSPRRNLQRTKVNFTFEHLEGQDEARSEASAFQRGEVNLTKPFLI